VLWVAAGGALGSVARYLCGEAALRLAGTGFPWGTLFVNVAGSFAIGFFFAATEPGARWAGAADFRAFAIAGVLGGFTTFSAFSLQTLLLLKEGRPEAAIANALGSVILCLLAAWLGYLAALRP